jgi:hypothetical protein
MENKQDSAEAPYTPHDIQVLCAMLIEIDTD